MHIPNSTQNTIGMIFFNLLAVFKSPNYYSIASLLHAPCLFIANKGTNYQLFEQNNESYLSSKFVQIFNLAFIHTPDVGSRSSKDISFSVFGKIRFPSVEYINGVGILGSKLYPL